MSEFDAIAKTCLLTAALRARESSRPEALYQDPFAQHFVGPHGFDLLDEIQKVTWPEGEVPRSTLSTVDYNAIRTRFFDDYLTKVVDGGVRQVVLAAAGMDARAYRLSWPDGVRIFEIDVPEVLAVKEHVLDEIRPEPKAVRTPVATRLPDEGWKKPLLDVGYEPDLPSVWLIEGLLYYVEEAVAHQILEAVRSVTSPGSLVAADIVNEVALSHPICRPVTDVFARWGCPWLFGSDEPEELMQRHGITAVAVQPGEDAADFGRWPDPVAPRVLPGIPRVFLVHGQRT